MSPIRLRILKSDLSIISVLLVFVALLFFTSLGHNFNYWGDTSYNLYTAWRIASGNVLYRDITYYHGPLGALLMGISYKIMGSALGPQLLNVVLVFITTCLLFFSYRKLFSELLAWLLVLFFLIYSAFANFNSIAHFQFIFPYKPEVCIGMFFVAGILFITTRDKILQVYKIFLTGLLFGGCALLSLEFLLAMAVAIGIYSVLYWYCEKISARKMFKNALVFFLGFSILPCLCFAYFFSQIGWRESARSLIGVFAATSFDGNFFEMDEYAVVSGIDHPWQNSLKLIGVTAISFLLLGLVQLSARLIPNKKLDRYCGLLAMVVVFSFAYLNQDWFIYLDRLPRAYPLSLLFFFFFFSYRSLFLKKSEQSPRDRILAAICAFALIFLGKIFLNPRFSFYGFFLVMPSSVVFFSWLDSDGSKFSFWPKETQNRTRWFFGCILFALLVLGFVESQQQRNKDHIALGAGWDLSLHNRDPNHQIEILLVMDWLNRNTSSTNSIQPLLGNDAIPYLLRKPRHLTQALDVFEYKGLGAKYFINILAKQRPDYLLLYQPYNPVVKRRDYRRVAPILAEWLDANYSRIFVLPDSIIPESEQMIVLLVRNDFSSSKSN